MFSRGRILVNGVVAINDIVDLDKMYKKYCLIFKVYFNKDHDIISFNF